MKKVVFLLFSLLLAGCGAEQITGSFKLTAAQGYVSDDNYETPHTYIIDSMSELVYVDRNEAGFTTEELEAMKSMSEEEVAEFVESKPVFEEPLYDIQFLDATKEEIILEYEGERVEFTALSDSYFEGEDGTQYVIEYDSTIEEYKKSKMGN